MTSDIKQVVTIITVITANPEKWNQKKNELMESILFKTFEVT